jgi:hypothetical protein
VKVTLFVSEEVGDKVDFVFFGVIFGAKVLLTAFGRREFGLVVGETVYGSTVGETIDGSAVGGSVGDVVTTKEGSNVGDSSVDGVLVVGTIVQAAVGM